MKIAICIGHNKINKGAFSLYLNDSEFDYNTRVANYVKDYFGDSLDVYNRIKSSGYKEEISNLAERVNKVDYDLVMELHFNAAIPQAKGVEALYFYSSRKGKRFAKGFCEAVKMEYGSSSRGAKPLRKDSDRGFGFVQKIKAPAIILEPFFGSNVEAKKFMDAKRYANTLINWINCIEL
ncbi:N-acetylmuramoyl-L-alanine amidase [Tamlana sp. s12]|uniref:N-acetylmuramoyl-L-alanine amidase n=1 Tax=Tamlana sp. s12 TaxID=1630406 RepID=UPI0007FE5C6B|nr:N-acetylmuramoyl-L-alanine amidase [Tamlana sp. s12]OBQ56091.1 hypothetical protein VQ01_06820 [Tamlana sp. s12]QQY83396.1 N-acetylmuramoyl-L-alanine amidase [Tamlana sp. s12]